MDFGGRFMSQKKIFPTPQQKEAANPVYSVWVTANAGSGKTHVLVERVVRLLLAGAEPASILCITYTKAAAAEMSARLFAKLGAWTALSDEDLIHELCEIDSGIDAENSLVGARRLFTRALETPGGLKIQTIHAFCEKLLHLFPVEAGLAPGFRVLDDRREQELREEAIQNILNAAKRGTNVDYSRAFSDVVAHTNSEGFADLLREFLGGAKGLRAILSSDITPQNFCLALKSALELDANQNVISTNAELSHVDRMLYAHHAPILATHKPHHGFDAAKLMMQVASSQNSSELLQALVFTKEREFRKRDIYSDGFQKAYPDTANFIDAEKRRTVDLIYKRDLHERVEATTSLFVLARAIQQEIEINKRQLGLYDFDDLISRTAKLLNNSRAAQWVLYKLDSGLTHILIDEAQDTSPAQWDIITALADEFFAGSGNPHINNRTLFGVGDRKQSIYSFQGADAASFAVARSYFEQKITASDKEFRRVDLSVSYRSTQIILDVVDGVFPVETPLQLGFPAEDRSEKPHQSNRLGDPGVVEVWPLYEPLGKEEEQPWKAPVDREDRDSPRRRLAKDIATTIKSWIGRRIIAATNETVKAGDILILLQSRGPIFSMLIAELRKAGVPVAGADRLNLLESLAIQDLLALTQWLILPQDDYALACVLKSPLVPLPLSEDQLFELTYNRGTKAVWSKLLAKADANSNALQRWVDLAKLSGPYDFFAAVLLQNRKAMVARLGTEALDATDAFLDQALVYEQDHGRSLAGFMHWFMASETKLKREMEKDTGEVRLMTVHGAKGLEAKIVFLPDAANISGGNKKAAKLLRVPEGVVGAGFPFWNLSGLTKSPIQESWENAENIKTTAERNRLLYVAMTRACDELYICGWKGANKLPDGCWYQTVEKGLQRHAAGDERRFGAPFSFRELNIISPSAKPSLDAWLTTNPAIEKNDRIHSLTGLIARRGPEARNYDPVAARRGISVHSLLQELPDIAPEKREAYASRKAKRTGLDEGEAIALAQIVNRPEITAFFGPHSSGEAELRGRLSDGRMVSGRVDRIAVLPTEIFLLDYKTDRTVPETLAFDHAYVQQLSLYVEILENAYPDRSIKAALLWTQTSRLEWISKELLTQARDQAIAELEPEAS
jgi:ATP-dependent helicase/nuclease subunit A